MSQLIVTGHNFMAVVEVPVHDHNVLGIVVALFNILIVTVSEGQRVQFASGSVERLKRLLVAFGQVKQHANLFLLQRFELFVVF